MSIIGTDDANHVRVSDCDDDLAKLSISGDPPMVVNVSPTGCLYILPLRKLIAARKYKRRIAREEQVYTGFDRRDLRRENIEIKS